MTKFEKNAAGAVTATVTTSLLSEVFSFLLEALLLLWVCGVLLPIFPWLAALAGLTYFDWVAIAWAVKYVTRSIGRIFHS